jgi:MFS-type transporter involved in bile tolerance (Atg22 family)
VRKREVFGWAMFDFANQAYTLLIITVVFGDLFTRVIVGDAEPGLPPGQPALEPRARDQLRWWWS